jgi:predicted flap endonuclease-1-like 5' DNA nuclease
MASYKIEDIEGIGAKFGTKLLAAGVKTTNDLLKKGGDRKGRKALADATGISGKLILKWANHSDLMRISGVGPEFAELLEGSGVDTIKELRRRNAANLAVKMAEVKEKKKLTRAAPSEKVVTKWIAKAAEMEPKISY